MGTNKELANEVKETSVYFSVVELKKMLNYAEQLNLKTVRVTASSSSGIGQSTVVSKMDGTDKFDVTDVSVW